MTRTRGGDWAHTMGLRIAHGMTAPGEARREASERRSKRLGGVGSAEPRAGRNKNVSQHCDSALLTRLTHNLTPPPYPLYPAFPH